MTSAAGDGGAGAALRGRGHVVIRLIAEAGAVAERETMQAAAAVRA